MHASPPFQPRNENQCADNQQSWYITGDNRLALENQGLCLDLTDGSTANGNGLQVWECGTGNKNQEWNGAGLANARRRRTFN